MTTKEAGCKEEEEKVVYFFNFGNVAQSIDSVYQIESRRQVPSDAVDGCTGEFFQKLLKKLMAEMLQKYLKPQQCPQPNTPEPEVSPPGDTGNDHPEGDC